MPNIILNEVRHSFVNGHDGELLALKNISFNIADGEFLAIVGPSGCGKTTLLRIIAGLIEPTSGTVEIDARSPNRVRERGEISFMFQSDTLLPWRTVAQNIALPFELSDGHGNPEQVESLVSLVDLDGFQSNLPSELSGGMRSRVALARSLALSPSLLLLDEPFGSLDESTSRELNIKLNKVWLDKKPTVILVTHNIEHAVFVAQNVYVLSKRPGELLGRIRVPLPTVRDRNTVFQPEFFECVSSIRRLLQEAYD